MADRLLTREELATKLRRSVAWTYRNLARIQRKEGFPLAVLGLYSEAAVDRWIRERSQPGITVETTVTLPPLSLDTPRDDDDSRLDDRARQLAHGRH